MVNKSQSRKDIPPISFILLSLTILAQAILLIEIDSNPTQSIIQLQSPSKLTRQSSSRGERLLIANTTNEKRQGIKAFANQDYRNAIALFQASLEQFPNDPETLIYLNNAKVATANPVKIAIIALTNSDSNLAQELLRGVAQAQAEYNSQGGNLQVEIVNDQDKPEIDTSMLPLMY